jgi:hypothetical protein
MKGSIVFEIFFKKFVKLTMTKYTFYMKLTCCGYSVDNSVDNVHNLVFRVYTIKCILYGTYFL